MSHAYRSVYENMVGAKLAEREAAHETALPWLGKLAAIQRARVARALAGAVGISGAVALGLTAALSDHDEPVVVLVASVGAMLGSWVLARVLLGLAARRKRSTAFVPPALSGDLKADLDVLDQSDPLRGLRQRLEQSESLGIDLFAIAVCLLAPLTLHLLFMLATGGFEARAFSTWIRISLLIVGHGHLALAILTTRFTKKLRAEPETAIMPSIHRAWGKAYGWTIAVTCLPGILLFAVPPILSAVTALAFVPFLFMYIHGQHHADRQALAFATAAQQDPNELRVTDSESAYDALVVPAASVEEEPEAEELSEASAADLLASRS